MSRARNGRDLKQDEASASQAFEVSLRSSYNLASGNAATMVLGWATASTNKPLQLYPRISASHALIWRKRS